jgi:sec-independent protein translocase protein TatC
MKKNPEDIEMPLIEHLKELQKRFIRALIAAVIGSAICFIFHDRIWEFLVAPLISALDDTEKGSLAVLGLLEGIITKLKVAGIAGILLASPIISYQIWAFVTPALYKKEKSFIVPLAFSSTALFFLGISFGYGVIFQYVFPFLLEQSPDNVVATLSIEDYLSTSLKLLFGFGCTFQLPVVCYFLARGGFIDHKDMIAFLRYAIVVIFVISAFLTPPDPLSQILMAIPLLVLYFVGIVIAWIFSTKGKESTSDEAE